MIAARLSEIKSWYDETLSDLGRSELLSKLAILEMCGWIEEEFDKVIRDIDAMLMQDPAWVNTNIIKKNSGFTYDSHLRQMLVKLGGEFLARRIEIAFDLAHPGDLPQLRTQLMQLYTMRCALAHTALAAAPLRQYTLNAPSVTAAQHMALSLLLGRFRSILLLEITKIAAV